MNSYAEENYDTLLVKLNRIFDKAEYINEDSIVKSLDEYYFQGITEQDSAKIAFSLFAKGFFNLVQKSDYISALDYYYQALKIYRLLKDEAKILRALLQIGVCHYTQKNYNEAIKTLEEVYRLSDLDTNKRRKAVSIYLIGLSKIEIDNLKEAKNNLIEAIELYEEVNYKQGISEANLGLGILYLKKNNPDSSLYYFDISLDFFYVKDDPDLLTTVYAHISEAHLLKKNFNEAISYARKSLENAEKLKNNKRNLTAYKALHQAYAATGNYSEAYNYYDRYNAINELIFNEENNNRLLQLRTNFEKEKLEREIAIEQARREEINAAQLSEQKLIKNFFVICFILVSVIIIVLFKRYKEKKIKNLELEETLEKLNKTQSQLLHHEKLASLGRLMAGIAHEIQNPLNFVNNFSELSKDLMQEIADTTDLKEKETLIRELKSNMEKINFHGKRADSIVRNMLQHSRKGDVEKQLTDINQLSSEFLNFAYYGYKAANKNINVKVEKKLNPSLPEIKVIQQDMSRVLINLFNNSFDAIHYKAITNTNGYIPEVILETDMADNKILIKIKDNGSGIPDDIKNKIFDPFFTTKPAGAGTGLGLSISNDIVMAHGGRIDVKTGNKNYTEIIVELPILN